MHSFPFFLFDYFEKLMNNLHAIQGPVAAEIEPFASYFLAESTPLRTQGWVYFGIFVYMLLWLSKI